MHHSDPLAQPKTPLYWLALLRIMVGLLFVTTWVNNLIEGLYTPDGLVRLFTEVYPQSENPLAFYAAFIENVILPVRAVFAPFQMVSELMLGLALLVGFFTPLFSLAGIFFLLNTFLATFMQDWYWSHIMPIVILAVVMLTHAGRAWGIDAVLARRFGHRWWW
jgi:NADH:ubiquinone reductase (H+-translocating)